MLFCIVKFNAKCEALANYVLIADWHSPATELFLEALAKQLSNY